MSLSYQKLDPVLVRDPVTILKNKREYAILKSGNQVTYKQFTTNSVSDSSIQFSCPPPSGGIIIDRKQYITLPVRLVFTGPDNGAPLLQPNKDAPRSFPFSSAVETLQVTINNYAVSINMADVIHALNRYNVDQELYHKDYSNTPNAPDQSQLYSSLNGSIRNPLAGYGDCNPGDVMGRGGFPFTIVSNTNTRAVVDMVITEPIFLSPFYWGKYNESGFYNVNSMDFNISFISGNTAFRMWSHDSVTAVATTLSSGAAWFSDFNRSGDGAFSYSTSIPNVLFRYITPLQTDILPYNMPITYPYFDIQRYPTDIGTINAGVQTSKNSNNIQLGSIPRRMYIYARRKNSSLYLSANHTDTYLALNGISIQFLNKNGLLASASKEQLYQISVENHCNMSWTEWSGGSTYAANSFVSKFGTVGSVLCVEFATNIGLDDLDAPGKLGQYQLQVTADLENVSTENIDASLYIVIVSEGTFTIEGLGKASTNIGVISSEDILNAKSSPWVNYRDVQEIDGGNFLSGLKSFGNKLLNFAKDTKIISKGLKEIPHPYAQTASKAAEAFGLGDGGVLVGGKNMSRRSLVNRL